MTLAISLKDCKCGKYMESACYFHSEYHNTLLQIYHCAECGNTAIFKEIPPIERDGSQESYEELLGTIG